MKKIFLSILCLSLLFFISCNKIQETKPVSNINSNIAAKLEELDNNFSDETLKALSIILRNNITIKNENFSNVQISEKYLKLAKSTENKTLRTKNNDLIEISLNDNNSNYSWQKKIKKSDILDFALKNDVNLANISEFEQITEDGRIKGLKIGNKYFDYNLLAKQFSLESNRIENISSNKNEIIITGKGKDFYNYFDTEKAEELSKQNLDYIEILAHFFEDFEVK